MLRFLEFVAQFKPHFNGGTFFRRTPQAGLTETWERAIS
jgi:hypothetical protein